MDAIQLREGRQVRRSTGVTDKKLAGKIYHKVMAQLAEHKWFDRRPGEEHTVRELLERYLRDYSARNKAPGTHRRDQSLAAHLLQAVGDLTLVEVRPAMLAEYKGRRRTDGAAPKTVNDELKLLGHAYKLAITEWEWVAENPVTRVAKERVRNQIERWLTLDEETQLLASAPPWLRDILVFALHTGLRQSEILNLQWRHVDLARRTLTILEQKNQGTDTLPLNHTSLAVLKAKAQVRHIATAKTGHVFANHAGNRKDARDLLRAFYGARKKAGIENLRFHDLRHTWATRLVQNGVDLYTVQRLGRWKTITMVMRYAHHHTESLRAGAEVLDRQWAGVSSSSTNLAHAPGQATAVPAQGVERIGAPGAT